MSILLEGFENKSESEMDIQNENSTEKFEHMGLKKTVLRGIFAYGYDSAYPPNTQKISGAFCFRFRVSPCPWTMCSGFGMAFQD